MQAELRKLAAELRKKAQETKKDTKDECAKIAQAILGLELLRRKVKN